MDTSSVRIIEVVAQFFKIYSEIALRCTIHQTLDLFTFDLLDVGHVIVNGRRCNDVWCVWSYVDFDNLTNWWRRRRMIWWWKCITSDESIDILLAAMSLCTENRRLRLNVKIRRAVEISVKVGATTESTEESYSRTRLKSKSFQLKEICRIWE